MGNDDTSYQQYRESVEARWPDGPTFVDRDGWKGWVRVKPDEPFFVSTNAAGESVFHDAAGNLLESERLDDFALAREAVIPPGEHR